MPKALGPDSGIAILDWISEEARKQLAAGAVLSAPSYLPEGMFSLVIQRFAGGARMPSSLVRIDALVPAGRKLLTWGSKFDMMAGNTRIASGTVTVPPTLEGDST